MQVVGKCELTEIRDFFFHFFFFLKLAQIEFRRDNMKLNIRKCFLLSWCNRAEEPLMSVIEMLHV